MYKLFHNQSTVLTEKPDVDLINDMQTKHDTRQKNNSIDLVSPNVFETDKTE
jgi:hypothetical protein